MIKKITISPATWVISIIVIIIGGYLYWFYSNFDKVTIETDIGASKEAKANPFFAAEKFLESVGKMTDSQKNYSILNQKLKPYDTLIIESSRVGLSTEKRQRIKDWISSGGHLILLATELYDDDLGTSRDVFLDDLGVRLYENSASSWDLDREENLTKVTFKNIEVQTKIFFDYNYYLQDASGDASFIGGNDYSDFFVQYDYDKGMITIVTDMNIWKNNLIDDYDHAMFLYQLVGGAENVWFLYNTVQPSLLSIMADLIPMVIISFVLMLVAILFSASWRKGPPKNDDLRVQREIMQHIEAAGEFSYRNDSGKVLVEQLMSTLEFRLKKSIHQYNQISNSKKIVKLSQLTGKSKNELALLWQDEELTQDSFIKKVLLIQELKKQI